MFLNELNKNESISFLSLVRHLAIIDNELSIKEEELINEYKEDLKITSEDVKVLSFEESISEFATSSFRVKNIVYFELAGLALIDGIYEAKEEEFLDKISKAFEIPLDKQLLYLDFFKQVKDFYDITFDEYESKVKKLTDKALALLPQ